ncbi:hypothetical protein K1T71_003643 [Dendrolimus kikuchii]|uniref:Uncharacterized protein n=1 Tax=Dendrolimus kikuchii TaxID=765133 RepID=A0ACC1D8I8_9NEOP|nr:hypothetical protein K1T71_003643 [Dendrolimus kikuchii]
MSYKLNLRATIHSNALLRTCYACARQSLLLCSIIVAASAATAERAGRVDWRYGAREQDAGCGNGQGMHALALMLSPRCTGLVGPGPGVPVT